MLNAQAEKQACYFCDEIQNPALIKKLLGSSFSHNDRILYSSEHVVAIPGYGPQVYPYILILTKRHISSFLEATSIEKREIFQCLDWLLDIGIYSSSKLCVFEHGGDILTSCSCVDHCHLHVISSDVGLYEKVDWGKDEINCEIDATTTLDDVESYLLLGTYEHKANRINAKLNLREDIREHQYFRRRIAQILSEDLWSWKSGMNYKWIDRLVGDIKRLEANR